MLLNRDDGSVKFLYAHGVPVALAAVLLVLNPLLPASYLTYVYSENGFLECAQVVIAFAAAIAGLSLVFRPDIAPWLRAWVGIAILGCLYIGLEEISYGQQILQWETNGFWAEINDQNETNLHNTSSWLDQKPRLLLLVGIIAGGMVIPLLRRKKPQLLPARFSAIYPSSDLFTVATLVLWTQMTKAVMKLTGVLVYYRASELNEIYMYYFMLLYLLQLGWKLRQPVNV